MADNIAITPGTGATVATDDIGGVQYQRVKNTFGGDGTATDVDATHPMPVQVGDATNQANVLAGDTGQNSQVITGARKEVTFSTTTAQAVAVTDVSNYRWVSVQVTSQGGSSTVTFQGSNDGTNWVSVPMCASTTTSTIVFSTTTTALYHGPVVYRYFRLNVTGIASGTTAGVIEFFAHSAFMMLSSLTADTEMPSAATLADAAANPSAPMVAADNMVYNGATWDRARTANGAQGTTGTGVPAAGSMYFDGTNYQRVTPSAPLPVTVDTGTLLNRIEQLEIILRSLLGGAGAQLPDGVGRTRVIVDANSTMTLSGTSLASVTSLNQFGGIANFGALPALMNGGFDNLRRGITVS